MLAVLGGAFGVWLWSRRAPPSAAHKVVAVVHFSSVAGDRMLDWLDRGLTEMFTTNLSQVRGIDVLSMERIADVLARLGRT